VPWDFKNHATSSTCTVLLLYTVKEKGGKLDRKPPSLWFKKSIQKPKV
jgi:hypothetical protein